MVIINSIVIQKVYVAGIAWDGYKRFQYSFNYDFNDVFNYEFNTHSKYFSIAGRPWNSVGERGTVIFQCHSILISILIQINTLLGQRGTVIINFNTFSIKYVAGTAWESVGRLFSFLRNEIVKCKIFSKIYVYIELVKI